MSGAVISGWGAALPEKVVTNADFAARLDTSDEWIVERTGIRERRMGGTTSELAVEASRAALQRAGLEPQEVDLLVLSTTTADQMVPATSSRVHYELGLSGAAFDLNAACAGFVYALVVADSMLSAGYRRALVVGADTLSRITDQEDRGTAVLFADGAGAIVVEAVEGRPLVLGSDLGLDGSARPLLYCDHGGFMTMDGKEVFRRAVRVTVDSALRAFERAGVTADDIALFVPHQANLRIVDAVNQRLGLDRERSALVLDRTGNTSSGSIPLALADAADSGRLSDGDLVLFSGFGAGMTWASAVVRWGGRTTVPR
jgi:3-oxoacyl-[acyl-carrier-protein] synthase-3